MRPSHLALRAVALLTLLLSTGGGASAQTLRVVSSDDRGLTLRLALPAFTLSDPLTDGRRLLAVPGFDVTSTPGRPQLPYAQTLVALPPGAGAVARVVDGGAEEVREGVRLTVGSAPVMLDRGDGFGPVPGREPVAAIVDGPWPAAPVVVGEPVTVRRQRLVAVQVWPFRYDEAAGRLWLRRSLTVRVEFTGVTGAAAAPAAPDSHWEPVFRSALVNYEQGRRWRTRPAGAELPRGRAVPLAAGALAPGFDEDQPEVRIKVDTTGVYAFGFDDLAAHGFPAGVQVGQVSLHRHEYVGSADPPYETLELPIEVDDANGNGVFDSGDAIVAFVPNWVERSGVTSLMQRDWGDAEVVYATVLGGRPGLRLGTRPGWRNAVGLTPLASYPWTQRWERNFSYFSVPVPSDTATVDRFLWTNQFVYYSRPDTFLFETNDLDTARPLVFTTSLQGVNGSPKVMFGSIRNGASQLTALFDSTNAIWFDKSTVTLTATVPGTAATEGNTNALRLWGKGLNANPDPTGNFLCSAGLSYYQATYWRGYRALQGYLPCTSADATGPLQVHAVGFARSAIRVYDVTDILAPVRLDLDASHIGPDGGGGFAVDFQDSTGATPRRYVAFDTPHTLPPASFTTVTRHALTSIPGRPDYIVIVPEVFAAAVPPLTALRRAEGLDTLTATLESVNDQFNGGRKSKYAIKRFLHWAFDQWNTRFVVLVGDGSCDGRHALNESATDFVPVAMIPGPVSSGPLGLEMIPSDPWYGWCPDDDPACLASPLMEPDLWVGRLPVNSLDQANAMVAKLVGFEAFAADQDWRRRMLLLADDCYSGLTTFGGGGGGTAYCFHDYEIVFRQLNQACRAVIADSSGLGLARPEVLDLRSYLTDPSLYQANGPGDTCRVGVPSGTFRAEGILRAVFDPVLFQKLNDGVLWWNYQGHANQYVLSHEGFYRNQGGFTDAVNFMNDGRLFLFSAFSCHANGFAGEREGNPGVGPSLGETMVTLPARGAVASWASSGFENVPSSGTYHLNVEFARSLFSDPPHDDEFGRGVADRGARVPLGEAVALTLLRYLPTVQFFASERGVGLTYNLLGDPATSLWVGPAEITVTANGDTVVSGEPVRLATLGDTLRLEADMVSNVELAAITLERTDANGTSTVPPSLYTLTPPFPDTAAAGQGGRHYRLLYVTTLGSSGSRYTLRVRDRFGVSTTFDIVFEFRTQLYAGGRPLREDDTVAPDAALALLVLSPSTLAPDSLRLTVDNAPQAFVATPARGDTSGRQYLLAWTHAPYGDGRHTVRLEAPEGQAFVHHFQVVNRFALRDAYAFPNPFDDERGTRFVFNLTGDGPADALLRVFTVSGRLVYENRYPALPPGHHEIPWDGLDAEGQKLANGIYFYKLVAHGPQGTSAYDGRLVKLRRPRRTVEPGSASTP